jgi:hypothetical protein
MTPPEPCKWDPFVEQIQKAETLDEKVNYLAIMVRLLATNELAHMDKRIDALSLKFDKCMRKIYVVGIVILLLTFSGVDVETIVKVITGFVK